MEHVTRRSFLKGVGACGAIYLVDPMRVLAQSTRATDARIEVLIDEAIATINPDIYGHFTEHLGGVIYGGIWVGERSSVPNIDGIRAALVEALKRIKPPVIRYPGGCFADSYDWRDGVGARERRPRRTNFWVDDPDMRAPADAPQRFEPNQFGTNEFMRFCRLVGAEPYLAVNVRGLGAQAFYEWVEYCNAPAGTTTLAELRASGPVPSREPFRVRFWGIGNESWGCGGNLTPEEYAMEFRRFTAAVPSYGVDLKFIASGANSDDLNWTRGFFARTREKGEWMFDRIYGWGLHHYSWNVSGGRTTDWRAGKGDAIKFDEEQYYELLREADRIESLIDRHWAVMGEYDRRHRVKLVVDEWGTWYRSGTEIDPTHLLGQQSTMRDALVAALTLDTFNRHADKVAMANIAQLVNCLQSLFLTREDRLLLTPTYHVFEMFMPHMGAQAVRTVFAAPSLTYRRNGQPARFWGLSGSASLRDKLLTLTVVNPHLAESRATEIAVRGARIARAQARVLVADDVHAHNTFENPRAVEPRDEAVEVGANGVLVYDFRPASVTRLQLSLT